MRAFLAVGLPTQIRESVFSQLKEIRQLSLPVAWVPPENYHLTLRFLGDVDQQFSSRFQSCWSFEERQSLVCRLRLGGPGAFPSTRRPRVLWFDIQELPRPDAADASSEVGQSLERLVQEIDSVLEGQLGLPQDKGLFKPHLTVGRVRTPVSIESFHSLSSLSLEWEVTQFSLMESLSSPGHPPRYQVVHSFWLRKGPRT